jgi:lipoprotein-releasing system permease protein
MLSVSGKYAMRSLLRHVRRTILSVIGIGVGCGLCLFVIAFVRGESKMMLRAAAESGAGHLRIVPAGWNETRENDLRLADWKRVRKIVASIDEVEVVTPHARKEVLLGFGTRVAGVVMVGVDPNTEQAANRLVRNVIDGHYLDGSSGTTVIGKTIATRLRVDVDDQLMVTAAGADGQIAGAMLTIVGIVETGSSDLDATICQVNLQDVEQITHLPGAGDLTILVKNPKKLKSIAGSLSEKLGADYSIVTWEQLMPELASGVKVDETWTRLTVAIVMIVVFLGIASAQLTAVLERRREFAVLSAVGMKGSRLVRIMIFEGLALGLAGAVVGLMIGVPCAYWIATKGIDFASIYGTNDMSVSNILIDLVFKGDFGWWLVPLSFVLALTATILSSLYPAWYAAKTDPAAALRVEH